jgi:hypothetical protein
MSKYLTGNKDLDMEIILNLRDDEIEPVCNVNKYVKDICESEIFWYRRIAKRLEYAKNENFKLYKELKIVPIDREGISQMRKYFGFKNLKELNDRLNIFLPKALYFIYYDSYVKYYDRFNEINKELLPKYINYDELLYEARWQYIYGKYKPRDYRDLDEIVLYLKEDTPGVEIEERELSNEAFSLYKKLEII